MVNELYELFVTLFIIVDPLGVAPVFVSLTQGLSATRKRQIALKACLVAGSIYILFSIAGDFLLKKLQISQPAFSIAGGILLLITGIDMVLARTSGMQAPSEDEQDAVSQASDISVFPLAIPFLAGPGGLATTALFIQRAEGNYLFQLAIIGTLCFIMVITLLVFYIATPLSRYLGPTGANVINRVFGVFLSALSIQYILDGIRTAFF